MLSKTRLDYIRIQPESSSRNETTDKVSVEKHHHNRFQMEKSHISPSYNCFFWWKVHIVPKIHTQDISLHVLNTYLHTHLVPSAPLLLPRLEEEGRANKSLGASQSDTETQYLVLFCALLWFW